MTERVGHIVELQSLRGIAAVAVVAGHTLSMFVQPHWLERAYLIFNGRGAVTLFFVLSGFVLTLALERAGLGPSALINYWVRRGARIYPAIWSVSAVALAYVLFIHQQIPAPDGLSSYFSERYPPDRLTLIHLTASFAGALAYLIPPLWSIFVELVASFFLPFIAFLAWRNSVWFHIVLTASIAFAFIFGPQTYYHVGLYAMNFFIGAGLATVGPAAKLRLARLKPISGPALLVLGGGLACSRYLPLEYYHPLAALYEAVLAAGIIALIAYGRANAPVLRSKFMLWLGDVSYSVYLAHYLVASLLIKAISQTELWAGAELGAVPRGLVLTGLTLLITLPVAGLSYRFIEKPGIGLGKAVTSFLSRMLGSGRKAQIDVTPP